MASITVKVKREKERYFSHLVWTKISLWGGMGSPPPDVSSIFAEHYCKVTGHFSPFSNLSSLSFLRVAGLSIWIYLSSCHINKQFLSPTRHMCIPEIKFLITARVKSKKGN